jgi:nitroreductase
VTPDELLMTTRSVRMRLDTTRDVPVELIRERVACAVHAPAGSNVPRARFWSFMLAARARGLGTCWTTMHLRRERDIADVLGISFDTVQQACLTPLSYTVGSDFRPAKRLAPEDAIHWDGWQPEKPMAPAFGPVLTGREPAGDR